MFSFLFFFCRTWQFDMRCPWTSSALDWTMDVSVAEWFATSVLYRGGHVCSLLACTCLPLCSCSCFMPHANVMSCGMRASEVPWVVEWKKTDGRPRTLLVQLGVYWYCKQSPPSARDIWICWADNSIDQRHAFFKNLATCKVAGWDLPVWTTQGEAGQPVFSGHVRIST